jgi:hypothetical protein
VLLAEMVDNVRAAVEETTALAESVYPPLLEGRGLASAIRSAAGRAGVTVLVDLRADAGYPPEITTAVYWSCVEALSPASGGSQATVSVTERGGVLAFDVEIAGHVSGGRLDRLRDRLEALDGGVVLGEATDGRSRVQGWLPLSG